MLCRGAPRSSAKMWVWMRTRGTGAAHRSVCRKDVSGKRLAVTFTSWNAGDLLSKRFSSHVWKPQSSFYTFLGETTSRHAGESTAGVSRVLRARGIEKTLRTAFFPEKLIFYSDITMESVCFKKPNTPKLKILLVENKIILRAKPAAAQRGDGMCPPISLSSPGQLLLLSVCPHRL